MLTSRLQIRIYTPVLHPADGPLLVLRVGGHLPRRHRRHHRGQDLVLPPRRLRGAPPQSGVHPLPPRGRLRNGPQVLYIRRKTISEFGVSEFLLFGFEMSNFVLFNFMLLHCIKVQFLFVQINTVYCLLFN